MLDMTGKTTTAFTARALMDHWFEIHGPEKFNVADTKQRIKFIKSLVSRSCTKTEVIGMDDSDPTVAPLQLGCIFPISMLRIKLTVVSYYADLIAEHLEDLRPGRASSHSLVFMQWLFRPDVNITVPCDHMENLAILMQVICDYTTFNWPRFEELIRRKHNTLVDLLDDFWREYQRAEIIVNMSFRTPWLEDQFSDVSDITDLHVRFPNFMGACHELRMLGGKSMVMVGDELN